MVKNPPANAEDGGSIPGSARSPGGGNGNPLQYSCLGSHMDKGAWLATVHGFAESDATGWPSTHPRFYEAEEESGSSGHYPYLACSGCFP